MLSVCFQEHLTDCGVVEIYVFGAPLLGEPLLDHGLLIELDVNLCKEVVVGLRTRGSEVLVIRPHLLGDSAQGYLLLNLREDKDEEEENEIDEEVKKVKENAQLMHANGDDHGME